MGSIGRTRKAVLLGGSALAMVLSASPGALAQDCVQGPFVSNNPGITFFNGFESTYRVAASTASSLSASIGNVDTVFLTQQGSAFVSNPGGAPPNTQGGGVWARGLAGQVETNTTSTSNLNMTGTVGVGGAGGPFLLQQSVNCNSTQRQDFGGVQVGSDVARLNMGGWNVNIGTTAGYLEARAKERLGINPFETDIEVPFAGSYIVATYGNFFVDAMVRTQYYNIELNSPNANLYGQPVGANGLSFSASAGYQFQFGNNWFIEPSAGFVWSKTEVDAINMAGAPGAVISGTLQLNDIESQIGRLTLRVGTTFASGNLVLQPFVTGSVFHEFADDTVSNFTTCPSCLFFNDNPAAANITTTASRIGTYGQISAGIAGQVVNTGWVGFVRGDYRQGDDIEGWTANAGLRYNFLPAVAAAPVIGKGPVYKAPPPVVTAVNWTGFYVGGFFGANYGDSEIRFLGTTEISNPDIKGFIGGGTAGYNHQFGTWVLGVEGDIGATNKTGGRACGTGTGLDAGGFPTGAFSPFYFTCQNELEWLATVGARVGFTWDRALFYAKGGGAWTTVDFTANCILGPRNGLDNRGCFSPGGVFTDSFGTSNDRWGYMVGLGTEFALNSNWSAKAEWNYIDFGRDTFVLNDGTSITDNTSIQEVKIGVNYHFTPMTR